MKRHLLVSRSWAWARENPAIAIPALFNCGVGITYTILALAWGLWSSERFTGLAEKPNWLFVPALVCLLALAAHHTRAQFERVWAHIGGAAVHFGNPDSLLHARDERGAWRPVTELGRRRFFEAHARRYIGDMGFKLAPGGSAEEGRADILILASASTQSLEPRVAEGEGYQGVLYVEQISISTGPVKFKARDSRARPMEISASAMHANRDSARAEAAEAAGQALAHALLERVIRELFAGRPLPVTP